MSEYKMLLRDVVDNVVGEHAITRESMIRLIDIVSEVCYSDFSEAVLNDLDPDKVPDTAIVSVVCEDCEYTSISLVFKGC